MSILVRSEKEKRGKRGGRQRGGEYARQADSGPSRRQKGGRRRKTRAKDTELTEKRKAAERFIAQKACAGKEHLTSLTSFGRMGPGCAKHKANG